MRFLSANAQPSRNEKAHEKRQAHEMPCGTKRPCGSCSGGLPPRGLLVVPPRPRPPHPRPPLVAAPFGRALVHGLGNNAGQRIQPLRQPCAPSGWTCAAVGFRVARVLGARVVTPAGVWVSASPRTALPWVAVPVAPLLACGGRPSRPLTAVARFAGFAPLRYASGFGLRPSAQR